jgi:hypothetical protein
MADQGEFTFDSPAASEAGHEQWLAGRRATLAELAQRLNLPLGSRVELWLRDGSLLRGVLRLKEDPLFLADNEVKQLQLMVDRVAFGSGDIDSCVRLD